MPEALPRLDRGWGLLRGALVPSVARSLRGQSRRRRGVPEHGPSHEGFGPVLEKIHAFLAENNLDDPTKV